MRSGGGGAMRGIVRRSFILCMLTGLLLAISALTATAEDVGQAIAYQYGLYPDYAANYRVQYVGQRLAFAAEIPSASFQIYNAKDLNAMALPDGRVFITSKMATEVTDDELAFVIGHELTHIKEKHAQRQMERANGGAILGAILVGVLGGDGGDIRLGADIAGSLALGHYSQKDEYKADAGGVRLMARCGYDPSRAADAMQRLLDLYGRGDAKMPVLGWFATHPDTKNRKQRVLDAAAELAKEPLPAVANPVGIELTLDPSAEHARTWAHTYLSILLTYSGSGRVAVLSVPEYPLPAMYTPPAKDTRNEKKAEKDEALPQVTVAIPNVPVGFRATLFLRQAPAGGAASVDEGIGTAVEARIHWTQLSTGFSGDCVAIDQTRNRVPWQAQEQLGNPELVRNLEDGKNLNIEGTLEARAIRRASTAFAEIIEANGPIDHSAPVTVRLNTAKLRPGDYVYVIRGNRIVAEVGLTKINGKKEAVGTVLWGTHTWKKKDRFLPADR